MIRNEKEAEGYDKEAYEYACGLATSLKPTYQNTTRSNSNANSSTYLFKLEGPFGDVEKVNSAAGLSKAPPILSGADDDSDSATFCKVDARAKDKILSYLIQLGSSFQPTFVRYSKAQKDLSNFSAYPTLGRDATMPQHRSSGADDPKLLPGQDKYPVWYFFYGTLADPAVLERLLGYEPSYRQASVTGGALKTWGGKYNALIDAPGMGNKVHGSAFLVQSEEEEDCLCLYETDKYEVVRCLIEMGNGANVERGLTFRFIGECGSWQNRVSILRNIQPQYLGIFKRVVV